MLKNNKTPHQNMDFQNDIDWLPSIEEGQETVQKISPDLKKYIDRNFRYEFLPGTPPRRTSKCT